MKRGTEMKRRGVLLAALFLFCCLLSAQASDSPQVLVVSRDPSSIGVEARNFPPKQERALFYRVSFAGADLVEKEPLPQGPFQIPTDETGVYTLTIFSQKTGKKEDEVKGKTLWKQDLFAVRYSDRLNEPDLRERLARKHAPIALFHREEEFYPSSIPYILNEESTDPELAEEKFQVRRGKLKWISMSYSELPQYLATQADRKELVDTPRLRKIVKADMDEIAVTRLRFRTGSPDSATLYYSLLEDPREERAYLNYHFLYAYDPKTGSAEDPSKVGHVFDRESLTVVLDTTTMEPEAVVFGAHLQNQTMGLFTIEGEKIFKWKGGRVRIPWDDVDKLSDHPFAAVARGSHGIYPIPGLYAVLEGKVKLLEEAAGGNRILVPQDLSRSVDHLADSTAVEIVPYELLDLGLDVATSLSWNRVLIFSGKLIDVPGSTNASFPPFTNRETDPISYGEGAVLWPVAEIPSSARDHIELLMELLDAPR
jgi:hypothetical protein